MITSIEVDGVSISSETDNAQRTVAMCQRARRFAQVDSPSIGVEVSEGTRYVRFECWGCGETFAWTQPFFIV